jgi:hypothetical protein
MEAFKRVVISQISRIDVESFAGLETISPAGFIISSASAWARAPSLRLTTSWVGDSGRVSAHRRALCFARIAFSPLFSNLFMALAP